MTVHTSPLPSGALLDKYRQSGAYTDCFTTVTDKAVTHAEFVTAFYTTWVFKLERVILKVAVRRPSTDEQAAQLAAGKRDTFAAWDLEDRRENQLLMCDMHGRTRSWLMTAPCDGEASTATRLYFGSAVLPKDDAETGKSRIPFLYRAVLGLHRLYSVVLLSAARRRLK